MKETFSSSFFVCYCFRDLLKSRMGFDILLTTIAIAGLLGFVAVTVSIRHIHGHLTHYVVPKYQLHIVRILAMVPIYSITSWLALVIRDERWVLVLDLIRDSYEAYVIYNFVILLINYGGGHLHLCRYLEDQPRMEHPFPLNGWLPPLKLGPAFLSGIRASVLQFVFIKPINSVFKLYLNFHEDDISFRSLILIAITLVNNMSVSAALYGLVLFYHAAIDLLRRFNPFAKFMSVKAVVFFSFWQGIVIGLAVNVGIIQDVGGFSASEQATGLQDVLICFEMAVAAVAHLFVFSYTEYTSRENRGFEASGKLALLDVVDFRDVLSDAKDRFYGGVGYESELIDGAPIIQGNALGETGTTPSTSDVVGSSANMAVSGVRMKARDANKQELVGVQVEEPKRYSGTWKAPASVSEDLMASSWMSFRRG